MNEELGTKKAPEDKRITAARERSEKESQEAESGAPPREMGNVRLSLSNRLKSREEILHDESSLIKIMKRTQGIRKINGC